MNVTLYAHRLSQPSRAVEILLRELAIAYAWREIDFANGHTRAPRFAQRINPLETIPALAVPAGERDEKAWVIGESHAIMRYLCHSAARRDTAARWYPGSGDARRAAGIDQWLAWHHNNVRRHDMFHHIMNLHLTLPMLKREIQATLLAPLQRGLRQGLAMLEQHFEQQQPPATAPPAVGAGDHPTLADLAIACELYQIVAVGYRFGGYPRVARWLDAMAEREHFAAVSSQIVEQGRDIREQSGAYLALDAFA